MEKYTLAFSDETDDLIKIVNEAIELGYKPVGGMVVHNGWYIQTLYKEL